MEGFLPFQLKQEIEDHRGHVNTLCFDEDGQKMYSGDSAGNIIIWNVFTTEGHSYAGELLMVDQYLSEFFILSKCLDAYSVNVFVSSVLIIYVNYVDVNLA